MKYPSLIPLTLLVAGLSACGGGGSSSNSNNSNPTPTNTAPIATNDTVSANLATETSIDVLANDSDSDGDSLTISSATADSGGTVTIESGVLSYTSANNFLGTETITYEISDGNGGSDSATVAVDVSVTIALSGKITDEPIPDAAVVVTIGDNTVEAQADSSGNYELSITSQSWDDFITINATGQEDHENVELISQVGDLQSVYDAKGDDDSVEKSELHRLNVTNVTTASYALITRNNENEPASSQAELEALETNVDANAVMELAAAIKSIVDNPDATLPDGIDTVLALALDEEAANDTIESISDSEMQELYAAMASDPELVAPVTAENTPEKLYLTWSDHRYSAYFDTADAGWELQFNDDQSGTMYTQKAEPLNKLTFNWAINDDGNVTITFSSPPTQTISINKHSGERINGTQELNQFTLVRLTSSSTVDSYIVTASYSAIYDDAQYNRSGDIVQWAASAQKGNSALSFTAEELIAGSATYALPVIFHEADKSIFADILVFHEDGSLNSVDSSSWSITDGILVLSLADGRSIEYQKMFMEDEGVTNVQVTIYDSSHNIIRTYADLMIEQQSDMMLSQQDLTDNYWHFIDEGDDTNLLRHMSLLDRHYSYKSSYEGDDNQGNAIYSYESIFYRNYIDLYGEAIGPIAFWFYENGMGIEGLPSKDQGTFEANEQYGGYYNEWVLNDEGTRLTMQEGFGFPLNAWGGYEIKPIRRNGGRLYVLLSHLSDDSEVAEKNVSFFSLVPRSSTANANVSTQKAPKNFLKVKQDSLMNNNTQK